MSLDEVSPGYGVLLRQFRRSGGLSQEELAEAAGVSVRTVRNLESGQVLPQRRTTEEIVRALALNITERDLLFASLTERRKPRLTDYRAVRCLPRDISHFVGRHAEVELLWRQLQDHPTSAGPDTVLVSGQPGVGKTSLAVHAAHRLSDRAAFVDLRGFDATPLSTTDALALLLTAFGIRAEYIPASLDVRFALYRALTSERAGLLVLDNAGSEEQVRDLLPTGQEWRTVVTSRSTLPELDDVRRISLGVPDADEALAMLRSVVGAERVAAETEAAAELVELCGRLPLAIRLCAGRLLSRPHWAIASWTDQMRDEHRRLDLLRAGDTSVRNAIRLSYDSLSPDLRRMLRLTASLPWPSVSVIEAATVAGVSPAIAESMLTRLVNAGLLSDAVASGYAVMHDLVRLFANEQPEPDREAAYDRLCEWLVGMFTAAGARLGPDLEPQRSEPATPGSTPPPVRFATPEEAVDWLDIELDAWSWAVARLKARGSHLVLARLVRPFLAYVTRRPHFAKLEEVCGTMIASTVLSGNPGLEGMLRSQFGWILSVAHERHGEAQEQFALAVSAQETAGDLYESAIVHLMRGMSAAMVGDAGTASAALDAADECLRQPGAEPSEDPTRMSRPRHALTRGALLCALGRFDDAITALHAGVELWEAAPVNPIAAGIGAGRTRQLLGAALMSIGDWDVAVKELEEAREILAEMHDPHGMALSTLALGRALLNVDRERAVETLRAACVIIEDNTDTFGHIVALKALGDILEPGDPERTAVFRRASALCEAIPANLRPAPIAAIRAALLVEFGDAPPASSAPPTPVAGEDTQPPAKPNSVHWM